MRVEGKGECVEGEEKGFRDVIIALEGSCEFRWRMACEARCCNTIITE